MTGALLIAFALAGLLVGAAEGQPKKAADNAALLNARGVALLKDGKVEEALEEFQKAAEADPQSAVIQSNLAYAYDRQGRTDDAVAAYKKVLEIEPGNTVARNNLGTLYSKKGLHDEAVREYEELVQRDPSNATAKANLENAVKNKATVQERQDQIGGALKGTESLPNDPRAAYNAARVYARLGDNDNAFMWLAKALELGYDQIDYLSLDPSLVNLRKDPRFLKLLEDRRR
jgi:tetratricopeptide (TPR) repeat protein